MSLIKSVDFDPLLKQTLSMAVLVSAHNISKSYGSKTLFQNISLAIESQQKIGLIGPNGAGKTTLLKIISRLEVPDEGKVSFSNGLRLGYLTQTPQFADDDTVFNSILQASPNHENYENLDLVQELISKLDLENPEAGTDRLVNELSGGWKKRVALARELARKPNLLLLDEPTNHLDLQSIMWLEDFLNRETSLAILTVTHDRLFLQKTCDLIFDLDRRNPDGLIKFNGLYSEFVEFKQATVQALKSREEKQTNTLVRETEWLHRGAQARQTKQKARIERAAELKSEVQELREKNYQRKLDVHFGEIEKGPKKLIEAIDISKTIDGRTLFKNFSFLLGPKARLGILGKNGCGKSTLIRTLLGLEKSDTGQVKLADGIRFAYFEQQKESLNPQVSLMKTLCPEGDYVHVQGQPVYARSYLARFHFRPEQSDLPVGQLSGGEQSRVLIAKLMLQSEPILVLDEPTNDLDMATLDTLQEALVQFPGAIILVTHDRYFMDQVANQLIAFTENEGEILKFSDYFQWEEWNKSQKKTKKNQVSVPTQNISQPKSKSKNKLSYKEQLEYDQIESHIQKAEADLSLLEKELSAQSSNYTQLQELTEKFNTQKEKVDQLYQRWEELNQKIND